MDSPEQYARISVEDNSSEELYFTEFSGPNAVKDGYKHWKSLWESEHKDTFERAYCSRDFDNRLIGHVVIGGVILNNY